jgi:asparaginyl-tRNA synthetase
MSASNYLWSERKKATIKVRAKILELARLWFKRHDFIEVQGPIIIPAIGNLRTHFKVSLLERNAYLTQGLNPYGETLMENLGSIYSIAPVFTAEKARTGRHLIEYWRIEAYVPHCRVDGVMKTQEQLVSYICGKLSEEAREELDSTRRDPGELERIQPPFRRLTYDDAVSMLRKDGFGIQWGAALDWEHEKHLSLHSSEPFFISGFPIGIETFFYQTRPQEPETTLKTDLLAPEGYGELSSGGQPIVEREELQRKMKEERIEPSAQEWYLGFKESTSIPYSGFAIGVERLTQWICRLEDIEEASAFPRTAINIYP